MPSDVLRRLRTWRRCSIFIRRAAAKIALYRLELKPRFSAFMQTELDLLLRRADIDRVAVMGQNLPNCPRATMVDAVALDYDVIAVEDGLATGNEDTRIANLRDLEGIGVRIATANEVIQEIHRAADRAASNEERR